MEKKSPKIKTYQKLNKFLEGCKVNKEDTFTHVSMCNPPGRYFISDKDILDLYKNDVYFKNYCKNNLFINELIGLTEIMMKKTI